MNVSPIPPLSTSAHTDLTVLLSQMWSSPKLGKQLTPWELCTGGLGCGKGKEASCGWSQSLLTIASLYWLCRIRQATVLSSLALLLAGTQEGGYLARSPGVCQDPGFVLGL